LVAVPLRADVLSPLAPRNDEEPVASDATPAAAQKVDSTKRNARETLAAAAPSSRPAPKEVGIELVDFERRAVVLPPRAGNYGAPVAVSGKVIYRRNPRTGSADTSRA